MTTLSIDFESFCELDLKKVGSSKYSRHHSARPLLLGWAIDDDDVEVVRFAEGEKAPKILKEALRDPKVIKRAWNAAFEQDFMTNAMGLHIPNEQWRCTMVNAFYCSLPGKLEKAGEILGLPEEKKKIARGKALIKMFCGPRKPTKKDPVALFTHENRPEEWEEFVEYCRRDVEAEREIFRKLKKWDLPDLEWENWFLDREINQAGIPINMRVVENARKISKELTAAYLAEMKKITGLQNPNSGQQLLPWLKENGYKYNDLKAGHIKKAYADMDYAAFVENPDYYRVLELRKEVSRTSVKKFNALHEATDDDGMLRNAFQFYGAQRTGRFGGRKFQPQNLAKPVKYLEDVELQAMAVKHLEKLDTESMQMLYSKPIDVISTCVRPVVQAVEGHLFTDADLNAIENRVLGWLADDQKILDVFRKKKDPYIDFATYMFKLPYSVIEAEVKAGDKTKRTVAKPGVLGCGYLLGAGKEQEDKKTGETTATGLLGYAWNMGVMLTPKESELAVKTFREVYEGVVQFWEDIDKAARRCIQTKEPQRVRHIRFDMSGPFLRMKLPVGRHLYYYKPRIETRKTPWGKLKPTITYMGLVKGAWVRQTTHPGKLVENADQAISRDILLHGLRLAKKRNLDCRLHVHDQAVTMEPADKAHKRLKVLIECMETVPDWAPGLILAAEGEVSHAFFKT